MAPDSLSHLPIYRIKPTNLGELAFLRKWNDLMRPDRMRIFVNDPENHAGKSNLEFVLEHYRVQYPVGQREATVAASLIGWLGSHTGQRFIYKAAEMSGKLRLSTSEAYLATWALLNTRNAGNRHHRTLEYILRDREHSRSGIFPPLSAQDYEVADNIVMWLGSPLGKNFVIASCEYIKVVQQEYMLHELAKAGRKDGPVVAQAQRQIRAVQENPSLAFANSNLTGETFSLFDRPNAGSQGNEALDFDIFAGPATRKPPAD